MDDPGAPPSDDDFLAGEDDASDEAAEAGEAPEGDEPPAAGGAPGREAAGLMLRLRSRGPD